MMRQAGRFLPEYRALREKHDFLAVSRTPELTAEVTLQPVRKLGVDAAILFADIMTPVVGLGLPLEFAPGPVIETPVRTDADLDALTPFSAEESVPFVMEGIRLIRAELPESVPLIGFAGGPWTVAAYLTEGRSSPSFAQLRRMLYEAPATLTRLLDILTEMTCAYVEAQVDAGAQAVQLFESWAGLLDAPRYQAVALPGVRKILKHVRGLGVPAIFYVGGGSHLYEAIADCGADVVSVDWRTPIREARARLGSGFAMQGNLDPAVLLGDRETIAREAKRVLRDAGPEPGHVFNLGHGILPSTPWENAKFLVETVHELSERGA